MLRGPITAEKFKGQFSGHETFPLRHLWLRKAYEATVKGAPKKIFNDPDSIVKFGVGKNMAISIRHWALACQIVEDDGNRVKASQLGHRLFGGQDAWDPYLERPATAWLIHWLVAGNPKTTTTWYWAFNHVQSQTFDHESLTRAIVDYARERQWSRVAEKTVARDVECFVRSYVARQERNAAEDSLEPVLAELGLIRPVAGRLYEFRRGPKPTLPDGLFAYALHEFWEAYAASTNSLSVEAIAYEPGSPGRVFKLDENSVVERLADIEKVSGGSLVWSDSAGLKQVMRVKPAMEPLSQLARAYDDGTRGREAA
jgi:hypothetical protein